MPLYDANFVRTIPNAQHQERRPLVNLKAVHPWILEKLSQWYDELLPHGDPDLCARLRDFKDSQNFIGAFWELVIYRYLRETGHDVLYNVAVNGKTPDFYWPGHDLIADVVAISDPHYGDAARAHIDQLTRMINREDLPFDLSICDFRFSESPRLTPIVSWLQRLGNLPSLEIYDQAQEYETNDAWIEVLILPRSEGARVKTVEIIPLDASQQKKIIKGRLKQKVEKYQAPIVVFVGQGLGFWTVNRDTMNMSLYGDWLIHFSRIPGQTASGPDTVANGVFYNRMGRDGGPANTNLSAVVLATHSIALADNLFHVWLGAFHNPEALRPLPRAFLSPMSQFLITSVDVAERSRLEWVDENEGIILGNPLPVKEYRIDTGLSH